jgi:hypothetical protein
MPWFSSLGRVSILGEVSRSCEVTLVGRWCAGQSGRRLYFTFDPSLPFDPTVELT